MYKTAEQHQIDKMVWSFIKDSTNPEDFKAFYRYSIYRPHFIKRTLDQLTLHQDSESTDSFMAQAVSELVGLAEGGSNVAAFHAARAHLWGIGVKPHVDKAVRFYTLGADRGDTRCMLSMGRLHYETDKAQSLQWLNRALEAGDQSAHCFLADHHPNEYQHHLSLGALSDEPIAVYFHAKHLIDQATCAQSRRAAIKEMRRAAQLGEGLAYIALGYAHAFGDHGQKINLQESEFAYRRAFEYGHEEGLAQLGRLLIARRIDVPRGEVFLEHSALFGNVEAQCHLGMHCLNASTTAEKKAKGVKWLRKAACQDHGLAMYWLSNALQDGAGTDPDPQQAVEWLQRGSELGSTDCQASLGLAYLHGSLIEQDKERAHHLFHLASLQGDNWATYLLGLTYEHGDGVEVNPRAAIECFEKASVDVPKAKYCLGRIHFLNDSPGIQDAPRAIKWLKLAADDGVTDAQSMLGEIFLRGVNVEANASKAYEWFKLAADKGHAHANYQLARLCLEGTGVKPDQNLGIRYMMKAASMGIEEASEWIKSHLPAQPQWLQELKTAASSEDQGSDHTSQT